MTGAVPLQQQIADGTVQCEGDLGILQTLADLLVHFDVGFEIMPGTRSAHPVTPPADPFVQEPLGDTSGG